MKKYLLIFCLLLGSSKIFAQSFLQYNTGTLFDSFENPAQRSFIPDSSRQFASNFLFPNFDGNFFLTGNGQQTLKSRYFNNMYDNSALQIGNGTSFNHVHGSADAYLVMLKMFTSLHGNQEIGFFIESNASGRGVFTDESIALLNGFGSFPANSYTNVFNSQFQYQSDYQIGFSYREQVTKQFSFGLKLAAVTGMSYEDINIKQSSVVFDNEANNATLALSGTNQKAGFSTLPFSNPGLGVSIGTEYKTRDGFVIQGNLKNMGFIHWNKNAEVYDFHNDTTIRDLLSNSRENNVYHAITKTFTKGTKVPGAFNTPLGGTAELSVNKSFWIDDEHDFRYSPTLIASKSLAYTDFIGAMVNPVSYKNFTLSVVTSYDDMHLFNFGAQFMVKSANAEFFIGSEKLTQSTGLLFEKLNKNSQPGPNGSFSGGDFSIGFSLKFGNVIEHPMNASIIPMGDDNKGFLGRIWQSIFNPHAGQIRQN